MKGEIFHAKKFSVVKPLNSGEAVASLASPVPPPLHSKLKSEKGESKSFAIKNGLARKNNARHCIHIIINVKDTKFVVIF